MREIIIAEEAAAKGKISANEAAWGPVHYNMELAIRASSYEQRFNRPFSPEETALVDEDWRNAIGQVETRKAYLKQQMKPKD